MKGFQIFQALINQNDASGQRSSVLGPLLRVLILLVSAILGLRFLGRQQGSDETDWVVVSIAIAGAVVLLSFLVAYFYSLLKNPELLRTEHYHLRKLEIRKGLMGDSRRGLLEDAEDSPEPLEANATSPRRGNEP
jgi:hypothetical protein